MINSLHGTHYLLDIVKELLNNDTSEKLLISHGNSPTVKLDGKTVVRYSVTYESWIVPSFGEKTYRLNLSDHNEVMRILTIRILEIKNHNKIKGTK